MRHVSLLIILLYLHVCRAEAFVMLYGPIRYDGRWKAGGERYGLLVQGPLTREGPYSSEIVVVPSTVELHFRSRVVVQMETLRFFALGSFLAVVMAVLSYGVFQLTRPPQAER